MVLGEVHDLVPAFTLVVDEISVYAGSDCAIFRPGIMLEGHVS